MDELRDIRGLREISWLPLAPGWWLLLASFIIVLILFAIFYYRRPSKPPEWQTSAKREWSVLQEVSLPRRQDVTRLAELLRRIAIQRYGREACAGLVGESWLTWLSHHDPQQFDWQITGKLLIEIPYLPEDQEIDPHQFKQLLIAVQHWI